MYNYSNSIQQGVTVDDGIRWIVEWLWIPLWGVVLAGLKMLFGMKEQIAVLRAAEARRDADRKEMRQALGNHNDAVLGAVSTLTDQIKTNGKRIGSIEQILMKRGQD